MKRVKCSMSKMLHDTFKEQQIVIKFLEKLGKTGMEIMPMLNVYSEVTMKNQQFMTVFNIFEMVKKM